MKKIFTLFFFVACLQISKAQFVTIPDANFVTWLQANVPSAMSGNQMDTTSLAVTNRTSVSLYYLNISDLTGIQYFNSLDTFVCISNPITSLPILSNTVKRINIYGGQLTSLSSLPSSLKYLRCEQNLLTSLPMIPNTLTELWCANNQLTSLPALPNSLLNLDCSLNSLSSLPVLPSSLNILACPQNQLTSLPTLPNSITLLYCYNNNLTSLPSLPSALNDLNCSNNQLINLPSLPSSLTRLICSYNLLTTLPVFPNSLLLLDCSHNQLVTLPNLPITLSNLNCSYNQLASLPILPIGLDILICSHNNIVCFPTFPNIPTHFTQTAMQPVLAFDIGFNPFSCLPNYIGGMDTITLNYPICVTGNTLTNPNGCETGKGITGTVFHDLNIDCQKNINELGIINTVVKLYDSLNTFMGLTNVSANGLYNFNLQNGTYRVVLDTVNKPFIVQCINPGIDSLVILSTNIQVEDSVDFAVVCKPGFDLSVQSIHRTGIAFPGNTHTLTIAAGDLTQWNNLSCAAGISGVVSFSVSGPVTYIGPVAGSLIPSVTGNVYTYNITDFGTINSLNDFRLEFSTNNNAQIWDMICITATITPIIGDLYPMNNYYQYCYPVLNSFDPNIKEVYPIAVQTGFNDWLTYTIHFQNTGNAPAINIRLEDQLDAKLDPETFQLINYSHNNVIDVTGNHLTVRFPNIQLADSTSNPQGSIGFVQYRIKPKASWVTDTIKNSAEIYFDYNAPIITNTAKSYFMTTTNINDISYLNEVIGVSPNPTNNIITITSRFDFEKVDLLSITGQVLIHENVNSNNLTLTTDNISNGIYFVKVVYPNGLSTVKKVIKQ